MELGLKDRVAIVCGASQGMGQAIAFGLVNEGARVLLVARNAERLAVAEAAILAQCPAHEFTDSLVVFGDKNVRHEKFPLRGNELRSVPL